MRVAQSHSHIVNMCTYLAPLAPICQRPSGLQLQQTGGCAHNAQGGHFAPTRLCLREAFPYSTPTRALTCSPLWFQRLFHTYTYTLRDLHIYIAYIHAFAYAAEHDSMHGQNMAHHRTSHATINFYGRARMCSVYTSPHHAAHTLAQSRARARTHTQTHGPWRANTRDSGFAQPTRGRRSLPEH